MTGAENGDPMASRSPESVESARPQGIRLRMPPIGRVLGVILDFVLPLGILYLLTGAGTSLYIALLASALYSVVSGVIALLRGRRDDVAFVMFLFTIVSGAIALVSGSDRFLLARESVLTAMMGCWFLASLLGGNSRPLTYRFTRPLIEGRFRTKPIWEYLWQRDLHFRHIFRVSTIIWAAAMFADAGLRVVFAYRLPVTTVPALSTGLMIVTVIVVNIVVNGYYQVAGLWPRLHGFGPAGMPDGSRVAGGQS